jgi:ABC-type nickel/cobalt efflux system permease component RcnA/ABC-type uncharacterized transport system substrate-binding protein
MTPFARLARLLTFIGVALLTAPAFSHPHIWITAWTTIVFDDSGAISGIRHAWAFDEAFSAWTVQGLDVDGDGAVTPTEMQELADENLNGLFYYGYYTFVGEGEAENLTLIPTGDQTMRYEGGQAILDFTLRPESAYAIAEELEIEVTDPEWYAAFSFAEDNPITLENALEDCSVRIRPQQALDPAIEDQLLALPPDVTELPPELAAAVRGTGNTILINCSGTAPVAGTAAEATELVAGARPAPFSAPPPEAGIPMPQDGFLGWIAAQQRAFYQALTGALARLRSDNNAFWVLGALSFLYGIFHAAGPGHGKVVISSYVLASEAQAARGIALSFAAALMQAVTAVSFILIAAGVLKATSLAISGAATWVAIGSYALVTLLGLWLIAGKLFGWGHNHKHDHHDLDDDSAHQNAVGPVKRGTDWRETLGVVFAVGLRPCSGALVVLVFALSQGVLLAGIAATFLMAVGTGLTVAVLATIAVAAKGAALRIGGDGVLAGRIVWGLELLGAIAVFGFGVVLLAASFVG